MSIPDGAEYWWPAYANGPEKSPEQEAKQRARSKALKHKQYLEREAKRKARKDDLAGKGE